MHNVKNVWKKAIGHINVHVKENMLKDHHVRNYLKNV